MALLVALFALSIVSMVVFFMTLNATTQVQISENFESQIQAAYAAMSGLNHARVLFRGLSMDAVLKGPDGAYDASRDAMAQAKTFRFRLPMPMQLAQMLDIANPAAIISGIPDDGVISTGFFEGASGTELIPQIGIAQFSPDPHKSGLVLNSRYFVKVTDNNGEPSERAGDLEDNPFLDGDGIVVVRSIGVSKTFSNRIGATRRLNSIAVYESRLKRLSSFNLGPALTVLGSSITALFEGTPEISGNLSAGIGTIDPDTFDGNFPDLMIRSAVQGAISITGNGLGSPSILDISPEIRSNRDKALLLQPEYLWGFIQDQAPKMADLIYEGSPFRIGRDALLGSYDRAKPWNAPGQNPKVTLIKGDLLAADGLTGGGLLIVTGGLTCSGPISFNGLILVIGSGSLVLSGGDAGVTGGILVASLMHAETGTSFGVPHIAISGSSRIIADREMVRMATSLIPVQQISFREISGVDP
jgi:hypothetical protein